MHGPGEKNYHNKGEQDASAGKYDPPHNINAFDILIHDKNFIDKMVEDNKDYEAGRDNYEKQK